MGDYSTVITFLMDQRNSHFGHQASEIAKATGIKVEIVRKVLKDLGPLVFSKHLGTFTLYKIDMVSLKTASNMWNEAAQTH